MKWYYLCIKLGNELCDSRLYVQVGCVSVKVGVCLKLHTPHLKGCVGYRRSSICCGVMADCELLNI